MHSYQIDSEKKYLIWTQRSDTYTALYCRRLDLKEEGKRLDLNGEIVGTSESLDKIYLTNDDTLYVIRDFEGREKIDDDVVGYSFVYSDGICYYTKKRNEIKQENNKSEKKSEF